VPFLIYSCYHTFRMPSFVLVSCQDLTCSLRYSSSSCLALLRASWNCNSSTCQHRLHHSSSQHFLMPFCSSDHIAPSLLAAFHGHLSSCSWNRLELEFDHQFYPICSTSHSSIPKLLRSHSICFLHHNSSCMLSWFGQMQSYHELTY